jgi:hypothetical protein
MTDKLQIYAAPLGDFRGPQIQIGPVRAVKKKDAMATRNFRNFVGRE